MSLQTVLHCPRCGALIDADDRFCEACGSALHTEDDFDTTRRRVGDTTKGAAVSDRGRVHTRNEDACAVYIAADSAPESDDHVVAVVCDGVSSSVAPDIAARVAADAAAIVLRDPAAVATPSDVMHEAITAANRAVLSIPWVVSPNRSAPSCTIVAASVLGNEICVGWVGDSRAYWIDGTESRRLTRDDSWAEEQISAGLMSEAEANADPRAHRINAWLGADAPADPVHSVEFTAGRPGWLVLCTDGLWNYVDAADALGELVRAAAHDDPSPLTIAEHLTEVALDAGGHDNITVAVLVVHGDAAIEEQR